MKADYHAQQARGDRAARASCFFCALTQRFSSKSILAATTAAVIRKSLSKDAIRKPPSILAHTIKRMPASSPICSERREKRLLGKLKIDQLEEEIPVMKSPGGAAGGSQGRKPLGCCDEKTMQPRRGDGVNAVLPPPLRG